MIGFKAGTTFFARGLRSHGDGRPYDLTNTDIRSELIFKGDSYPLRVVKDPDPRTGRYALYLPADETSAWPPGVYSWDIRYQDGEIVQSAPEDKPIMIRIWPQVTK